MTYWTIFLVTAEAAAETTAEGGLFDIDATLPLMALQFLILMAVLNALLYKPLGKAIDQRGDYVRRSLKEAREVKEKSEALAAQYENELREVRRQSQQIIADAKAEAEKISASKIQNAQQEVAAQRQKAADEIEAQKTEAMQTLEQQVDTLSDQILEKLLGAELVN
ncbi:F0F1 ATP synthase subunit B' [Pleurocapsales cyanobacterium LEGE 10410]|nr:F0F1 ATP synthase subunit B' [Pleurocapsales cyanobacterium LEGE 10410]